MTDAGDRASFDSLKGRLDEIVNEVERDDISLDEALKLYEEAVSIGIAACDASELDVPAEGAVANEVEADDRATEAGGMASSEPSSGTIGATTSAIDDATSNADEAPAASSADGSPDAVIASVADARASAQAQA